MPSRKRKQTIRRGPFTIRNSGSPKVSVVIPVVNERKTLARIIRQAARVHPETEVIVIANGSTDGSGQLARKLGARVISYGERLGHDVGRSIGAREAKGEMILFTDGDIVIPAEQFRPLIHAIENGVDVALNTYTGPIHKNTVHSVILAKHALNTALARSDLSGASMTTIPHAISRRALHVIGAENLTVPPKALAIAIHQGLNVRAVHYIDVGRTNPRRRKGFKKDPMENLIIGDHLEALHWFIVMTDDRGHKSDLSRNRDIVG